MMFLNTSIASNLFKQILSKKEINLFRKMSQANISDVILETIKDKGIITLNRPKVLNSLDLSMVNKITPTLLKWECDKTLVMVRGAGDKAFCAGGDVKSIAVAGLKGDDSVGKNFFKAEYTMNGIIGTYKVPYIAFIDGITMGGGVGLSVHGKYRVATERTVFAMPETQIALFPDVGTSYFLTRLKGKLGLFLALTGYRLTGWDVYKSGIATHYIQSCQIPEVQKELLNACNDKDIQEILKKYSKDEKKEFSLAPYISKINQYCGELTVEDIVRRFRDDCSEWSQNIYKNLCKFSPTSMKVTKELLSRGSNKTLKDCLQMEYGVAVRTLENKQFYEGVRALLIDKDQKPKWKPSTLCDVTEQIVLSHFEPLPCGEGLELDSRNNKL